MTISVYDTYLANSRVPSNFNASNQNGFHSLHHHLGAHRRTHSEAIMNERVHDLDNHED